MTSRHTPRLREELFGPILTIHVYEDADLDGALELCDTTSPYALTGAVFADDRSAIVKMSAALRHAAGNFYVNDKPTGAVVGQQPFGGARASGTNDKAGSIFNLLRWTSQRTIKETFVPPTEPGDSSAWIHVHRISQVPINQVTLGIRRFGSRGTASRSAEAH